MGPIPPVVLKEKDLPPDEDDMANGDIVENINFEHINNIIVNGDAFRENINPEDVDDIIVDDNAIRGPINFEDEYNIIVNDDDFRENINLEDGNDIIPNDDVFRGYNHFQTADIVPDGNVFAENNKNEDNRPPLYTLLLTPTLEYIKNALYTALHQFFEEFEVTVVSCPCLTRPPYNLAADGLSGNTGILQMGDMSNLLPILRTDLVFDIQSLLSSYCYDFFVIGSGFAIKPFMPYTGHLITNAIISANPINVINNSRIVYEDDITEQIRSEIVSNPNQMKCSMLGNFYFNEGRRGMVIKIRAKGRRVYYDIISLINYSLYFCCQYPIGLGGLLKINRGQAALHITSEWFIPNMHVDAWLKIYRGNCMDLIAVGALTNFPLFLNQKYDGSPFLGARYRFNIFSNYHAAGGFRIDVTPNKTEYIGYFNTAQRIFF